MGLPAASREAVPTSTGRPRVPAATIFAASFATVFLQVALMRLMAVTFHPVLVFGMIGVALLGYGAAGSLLAAVGHPRPEDTPRFVVRALLAAATVSFPIYALLNAIDIPSHVLFETPAGWGTLILFYLALALPFLGIGLAISATFAAFPSEVHRLYFADLAGAGTGGLLAVVAIPWLGGPALVPLAGLVAAASALGPTGRRLLPVLAVGGANAGAIVVLAAWSPLEARIPSDKHGPILSRAAKPGGLRTELSRWSRFGRVDVTEPFATLPPQFGGDFSRRFGPLRIEQRMLTLDGAAPAFLYRVPTRIKDLSFLAGSSQSVAYAFHRAPRVLVIGVGGGTDVLIALYHDARSVTAVELNPVNARAVEEWYAPYLGHAFADRRVELRVAEGRNFVARDRQQYDIVQLSGVDTGAAQGAYGLGTTPESHIYTVEAIEDLLDRLAPDGVVSITRDRAFAWSARVAALAREALRRRGDDPISRIAIVEGTGYGWATVLIKREPFNASEIEAIAAFAERYDFPLVYRPDQRLPGRYDAVVRDGVARDGVFDLRPSTDDWPFLFFSFDWRAPLAALRSEAAPLIKPLVILLVNLVGLAVVAILMIGLPLLRLRGVWQGASNRPAIVAYFALLGAGFILVEIALMQRFTIFLGDPALAVATVLAALLVASGLGSAFARDAGPRGTRLARAALASIVATQLLLATPLLPATLRELLWLPLPLRFLLAIGVVGLVGFPMGMPFPFGLRQVGERSSALVAWAWGINGMVSVVSSLGSYLFGSAFGYTAMFGSAALLYLGAFGLARRV